MKIKLLLFLFLIFSATASAQNYIFGKIISEENFEIPDVAVINIRTDERVVTNRDGHFMISGREGDYLRFVKTGYERLNRKVEKENVKSAFNITLSRAAELIAEVTVKKGLTGDLKTNTKTVSPSGKVQKLRKDMALYIAQRSDPRILAARPGEFVQPVTKGTFSIGKIKNKWDDVDFMSYLTMALGEKYFADLKIHKPQIQHFIYYVLAGGFERKNILKYGYVSEADLMRFQGAVLQRISSYRVPQDQK